MNTRSDATLSEYVRVCRAIETRARARIDATLMELDALIAIDEPSYPAANAAGLSMTALIRRTGASVATWARLTYQWRISRTKRWWRLLRADYRTLVDVEHAHDARHRFWHHEGSYLQQRAQHRRNAV